MSRQLVERAMHGDRDVFALLAERSLQRLVGAAGLIVRDASAAEDIAKEALVRAWRDLPSLRDPERFDAWQHRLLVRASLDHLRRHRHDLRSETPDPLHELSSTSERDSRLMGTSSTEPCRRLSDKYRLVIVLRYFLELSDAEVATATSLPIGTVKSRLHRALSLLRAELAARLVPARFRSNPYDPRFVGTSHLDAPRRPRSDPQVRELLDQVMQAVDTTPQRRRRPWWPEMLSLPRRRDLPNALVLLLVAVALALGGLLALTLGCCPPAPQSIEIRANSLPVPPGAQATDALVNGLVQFRGLLVAVGGAVGADETVSADDTGLIWRSTDGHAWLAASDPSMSGSRLAGIATDGTKLVAVGQRVGAETRATAWISSDGARWRAVNTGVPSFAGPIAFAYGRFFASGCHPIDFTPCDVFSSPDGEHWVREVSGGRNIRSIRATSTGFTWLEGVRTQRPRTRPSRCSMTAVAGNARLPTPTLPTSASSMSLSTMTSWSALVSTTQERQRLAWVLVCAGSRGLVGTTELHRRLLRGAVGVGGAGSGQRRRARRRGDRADPHAA